MSSFFGNIYENVASNYVATALSNGLSSITSAVVDNFGTVAFFGIGIISGLGRISGQAVSKFTGKLTGTYVQLNSFVPFFVRKKLQIFGEQRLGNTNEKWAQLVSRVLPIHKESIRLTIIAPIVEEFVFRLPLLVVLNKNS